MCCPNSSSSNDVYVILAISHLILVIFFISLFLSLFVLTELRRRAEREVFSMDSDEFWAILSRSGFGIWDMIDAAIRVVSSDYGDELRRRRDEDDVDTYGGLFDDEQTRILIIKDQLEDPDQSEYAVLELLHNL
ncbi:hypothetical protein OROGR_025614 [Orobanche gracilis]